jgi:hypothetical protein
MSVQSKSQNLTGTGRTRTKRAIFSMSIHMALRETAAHRALLKTPLRPMTAVISEFQIPRSLYSFATDDHGALESLPRSPKIRAAAEHALFTSSFIAIVQHLQQLQQGRNSKGLPARDSGGFQAKRLPGETAKSLIELP